MAGFVRHGWLRHSSNEQQCFQKWEMLSELRWPVIERPNCRVVSRERTFQNCGNIFSKIDTKHVFPLAPNYTLWLQPAMAQLHTAREESHVAARKAHRLVAPPSQSQPELLEHIPIPHYVLDLKQEKDTESTHKLCIVQKLSSSWSPCTQ